MKIALSVGHDSFHKGAESPFLKAKGYSYCEYDINKIVVEKATQKLLSSGFDVFTPDVPLPQNKTAGAVLNTKIHMINSWGADLALECHFNSAGNPAASGCEMLYFSLAGTSRFSHDGKRLAQIIQENTLKILNSVESGRVHKIKDRGAKGMGMILRVYGGHEVSPRFAFLTKTNMPALILEPLFLSNEGDMEQLLKGGVEADKELDRLATSIMNSLIEFRS